MVVGACMFPLYLLHGHELTTLAVEMRPAEPGAVAPGVLPRRAIRHGWRLPRGAGSGRRA